MRVLLLADDCNPELASGPHTGYQICRAIGNQADVVLATHIRNKSTLSRTGCGKCAIEYIDTEYIARPIFLFNQWLRRGQSVGWTAMIASAYPSYVEFERQVWKKFRNDLKSGRFDIVHRVNPISPTLPSFIAKRSPVPFVIGPLNGALKWPRHFLSELAREREWMTYVRSASRAMPYYQSTYHSAKAIIAAFPHTASDLPKGVQKQIVDIPESGVNPEVFQATDEKTPAPRKTIVFVGRLVPYKCADVVVSAFAASESLRKHQLRVIGDGPEMGRLQEIVRENHLESCVELLGWRSFAEVSETLRNAEIFAFPSIRELGANVLLEAMASRLVSVVVDYGAPGHLVNDERGIRVPMGPKESLVQGFARELEQLVEDDDRIRRLANNSYEFVMNHMTWDAKSRSIAEVYRWVLGERSDKPVHFY